MGRPASPQPSRLSRLNRTRGDIMTFNEVTERILGYAFERIQGGKRLSAEDMEDISKIYLDVLQSNHSEAMVVYRAAYVFGSTVTGVYNIPDECSEDHLDCIAHYLVEARVGRGISEGIAEQIWKCRPVCQHICQVNGDAMKRFKDAPIEVAVHADACDDTAWVRASGSGG
jgi:hypothetical protein